MDSGKLIGYTRHKTAMDERGIKYRIKRPVEAEAVFGMIKGNKNYRKFLLRGLEKMEIEAGLLALSHNLSKIASRNQGNPRLFIPKPAEKSLAQSFYLSAEKI